MSPVLSKIMLQILWLCFFMDTMYMFSDNYDKTSSARHSKRHSAPH